MNEVLQLLITLAPSIGGILGIIISVILSLKELTKIINEFRQSNELKENNAQISALLRDNAELKKLNERLLVEITRIKPAGWCDDDKQTH